MEWLKPWLIPFCCTRTELAPSVLVFTGQYDNSYDKFGVSVSGEHLDSHLQKHFAVVQTQK